MTLRHTLLSLTALALLSACGGGGGSSTADIKSACAQNTNMGDKICGCVADQARELSGKGQKFVAASFEGDSEKAERLRKKMEFGEITQAAALMAGGPARCAMAGN